jgi:hypothetical protein
MREGLMTHLPPLIEELGLWVCNEKRLIETAVAVLLLSAACSREQLGLPRIPVSATSPDGRFVAYVRNHPNLDPPSQTIWLKAVGRSAVKLRALGPDSDWCNTVVWSADSSTVSYLVQDARLITADARAERVVSEHWLTAWEGEYPPSRMARNLSLSADGQQARFLDCARLMTRPGYVHEATECSELRTKRIRGAP